VYQAQAPEHKNKEFEELAFQHMDSLYSAALRLTKERSDAQDLVQDSYLRAYRFFDKFKRGTNFKAWLFKILKNLYINKYRKESLKPHMVDVSDAEIFGDLKTSTTPEDQILEKLLDEELRAAMNTIPDDFRLAIILSDLEGFTYKEIAEIVDCPIGTIMSRLYRGRKLLRTNLYKHAKRRGFLKD
jgi:RNA polymerase sigma-70 factor (ECF subfamily)